MPGSERPLSRSAARRIQREKRRRALCWAMGLVLLVAAVTGLIVVIYRLDGR
jgi:hypothetical protein